MPSGKILFPVRPPLSLSPGSFAETGCIHPTSTGGCLQYRGGISYSQSEKFTVFLGSQVAGNERFGKRVQRPEDRILCLDIFFETRESQWMLIICYFNSKLYHVYKMLRNVDNNQCYNNNRIELLVEISTQSEKEERN